MDYWYIIIWMFNLVPALFAIQVLVRDINKCQPGELKSMIRLFMSLTIGKSVAFCTLQYFWIIDGFDANMDPGLNFGWMVFDFLNGFTNLTFVLVVRLYLRWKNTPT